MAIPAVNSFNYCLPYIFVFLCLLVMSLPVTSGEGISKKTALLFDNNRHFAAFLILFVFIGLRGFVLNDWKSYYAFYTRLPSLLDGTDVVASCIQSNFMGFEVGFTLLSILIKTISDNYLFYQSVLALIDIAILIALFKYHVPDQVELCCVFYFCFGAPALEFNLLRNAKSIMFFLLSIKYAHERRPLPYFALNTIGAFFHTSALIYFPLYFVLNKRFPTALYALLFLVGNFIYLLQIKWVTPIIGWFGNFSESARLFGLANSYLHNPRYNAETGITIGYLERFFTYIFLLCFLDKLCKKNATNVVFINILFLQILSCLYLSEMNILKDRFALLFIVGYWFVYPQVYSLLRRDFRWIFLAILLLYCLLKIMVSHDSILWLYDNALWLKYSVEDRSLFLHAASSRGN